MSVSRLEGLLDALASVNNFSNPESTAYRLRSPLMIRSFARLGKHDVDEEGRRIFKSVLAGYKASLFDLDLKIRGNSRAKLRPDDKIENLLRVYQMNSPTALEKTIKFLRRALNDPAISEKTSLSYFIEGAEQTSCTDSL